MIETLTTLILFILLSSAWIYGATTLFDEGMILENVGIFMDANFPAWVNKPLWRCPMCMASFHGSMIYLFFLVGHYNLWLLIPFCVCLCGVNAIINRI